MKSSKPTPPPPTRDKFSDAPPPPRGPGRPTEQPLTASIRARCTDEQLAKYIALGGSEWLRRQIDAASIHVEKPEK